MTFSAPWCRAAELRLTNRAVLSGFALDWQVDRSPPLPSRLTDWCASSFSSRTARPRRRRKRTTARVHLLADLLADLAAEPAFAELGQGWRAAPRRPSRAMQQGWQWKRRCGDNLQPRPTLTDYLDDADDLACTVVNVVHWIRTGGADKEAGQRPSWSSPVTRCNALFDSVNDLSTF